MCGRTQALAANAPKSIFKTLFESVNALKRNDFSRAYKANQTSSVRRRSVFLAAGGKKDAGNEDRNDDRYHKKRGSNAHGRAPDA
jgi:hypothetical protein